MNTLKNEEKTFHHEMIDFEDNVPTTNQILSAQEDEIEVAENLENITTPTEETNTCTSSSHEENNPINDEVVNCLALTVKKDYNLAIMKNVFIKAFKNIWRIAVSIFTLNFLKFFF